MTIEDLKALCEAAPTTARTTDEAAAFYVAARGNVEALIDFVEAVRNAHTHGWIQGHGFDTVAKAIRNLDEGMGAE